MVARKVRRIRLDRLNLAQPLIRSGRDKLGELAASIDEVGVLVPLVVRSLGGDPEEFAVIAGAGRLEALQLNGAAPSTKVPCVVVEVDDAEAMLLALVENVVREEMRPFDEAETARVLIEEYEFTQERVASALGLSQSALSKRLAVFRLAKEVVTALRKGTIELGPALALRPLEEDRAAQRRLLKRMVAEGLSTTQVKALVAAERFGEAAIEPLQFQVRGAGRVQARTTPEGRLRVVLDAEDPAALERLWRSLKTKLS